ncbi:helix-turn-helix domain-containing protein [Limnoglobus roseus]|uniref:Helix-turn-helix domain-containing protein n=1 Tax=Limnoglobus roseus TaxID=2598579 RepID=A0A5C1A8P4_9BACT|nr:helix-turn-helix domain-containing protein [Limnoglobus roseus]QEL15601.1 hypothetical protein PX52LOC_02534 [Limnoglobus roseus]
MAASDPLKPSEVARRLRVSEETVRSMLRNGELTSFKVRSQWRVRVADLEAYMNRRADPPADDSGTAPDIIPVTE